MSNSCNIDIVVGLQYGDEGKGKIVKSTIENNNYKWCVRFNGGPNAGHTIYINGRKLVTHQIPTGIIKPDVKCWIAGGCVIDLDKLKLEVQQLEEAGVNDIAIRLFISPNTHIITKDMIDYDKKNNSIGTTGSGIGPTYAAKAFRTGIRAIQIKEEILPFKLLEQIPKEEISSSNILLEGAQGFNLDIDWGKYPFVTSCNCIAPYAMVSTGLPMKFVRKIIGVAKIYETYVGANQFQGNEPQLITLQELGQEYGSTTGRKRQTNWLNIYNLYKSIHINNVNLLIFNKCDIFQQLGIYKMYDYNDNLVSFDNFENMKTSIKDILLTHFPDIEIIFSGNPEQI
jgi:adenylosuccinate synthase